MVMVEKSKRCNQGVGGVRDRNVRLSVERWGKKQITSATKQL